MPVTDCTTRRLGAGNHDRPSIVGSVMRHPLRATLLPNVLERSITPAGIQALLAKADQLGLLADIEYSRNDQVADAPNTVVEVTVGGRTYRLEAYALGMDGAGTPDAARQHLQEFVDVM